MSASELLSKRFGAACEAWLETRRPHICENTYKQYQLDIIRMTKTFHMFYLSEIDADLIRKYQKERISEVVGASAINRETSVLQQVLKRIGRWDKIQPDFQPLKLPKWRPGRIISEIERERLFRIGKENPDWEACHCFAVISVNSSAGPHELLTLRLKYVNLGERLFQVRAEGAKRESRIRILTLNDDSWPAMVQAVGRAQRLGATEDWHYLFPGRVRSTNKYDPTRHQTTFRKAWRQMTKAAGLEGLKMYDLRRTGLTDLLADEKNSEETVLQIAGHVDRRMLKHYSYRRIDKVRQALDRLALKGEKKPSASVMKAFRKQAEAASDGETKEVLAQQLLELFGKLMQK